MQQPQQQSFHFFVELSHDITQDSDLNSDLDDQELADSELSAELVCQKKTDTESSSEVAFQEIVDTGSVNDVPPEMLSAIYCNVHFNFSEFFNSYPEESICAGDIVLIPAKAIRGLAELLAEAGFDVRNNSCIEDPEPLSESDYQSLFLFELVFTSRERAIEITFSRYGCELRFSQSCDWSQIKSGVDLFVRALKSFDPAVEITSVVLQYSLRPIGMDMYEPLEDYVRTPLGGECEEQSEMVIDAVCHADGFCLDYHVLMNADPWFSKLLGEDKLLDARFYVEHDLKTGDADKPIEDLSELLDTQKRYINLMFWNVINDKWLQRRVPGLS